MNKSSAKPPGLPLKFLRWFCHADLIEDVEGDLSELYGERMEANTVKAKLRYWIDVLFLFRPGIIKNFKLNYGLINFTMLKNFLKVAYRNAMRYKGFTTLNLLGLVVGIASSLLILLWIQDEVSIDKFHVNGDKIYQVFRNMKQTGGEISTKTSIPKPMADLMRNEYSEVDEVVQTSWTMSMYFEKGDVHSNEQGFFATPNFLTLFSFEVLAGDKETALEDLNSVAISRSVAEKYFGSGWKETAIGASLKIEGTRSVVVSAVFENQGAKSTMNFDWLLPAEYLISRNDWMNDWGNGSFGIFFTTHAPDQIEVVKERMYDEIITHAAGQDNAGEEYLFAQKFEDHYLYSNFDNGVIS